MALAALACTAPRRRCSTGIEISAEAIACAQRAAAGVRAGEFCRAGFHAVCHRHTSVPQLVLVNPPRRGIGAELCARLSRMAPDYILYSSCNPASMAQDIARLADYDISRVQLFDMFPHTAHFEVLTLLRRKGGIA